MVSGRLGSILQLRSQVLLGVLLLDGIVPALAQGHGPSADPPNSRIWRMLGVGLEAAGHGQVIESPELPHRDQGRRLGLADHEVQLVLPPGHGQRHDAGPDAGQGELHDHRLHGVGIWAMTRSPRPRPRSRKWRPCRSIIRLYWDQVRRFLGRSGGLVREGRTPTLDVVAEGPAVQKPSLVYSSICCRLTLVSMSMAN